MRRLLKTLGWTIVGLIGFALLLIGVTFAVNWSDEPPSAAAIKLARLLDEQTPLPDDDNGYLYVLGFLSKELGDPQDVGARRAAWIEAVNRDPARFDDGPGVELAEFEPSDLPFRQEQLEHCAKVAAARCAALFDVFSQELTATAAERGFVARYRELLHKRGWRDVLPLDERLPYAPYTDILHAQRLMMMDLRRRAHPGAAADIRAALHSDHEFWRMVLASADHLISKMIAVSALRQNFYFGNLIVRRLPPEEQLAALPEGWSREFSPDELDVHRVIAGEWRMLEHVARNMLDADRWRARNEAPGRKRGAGAEVASALMEPWYQPQDQINHYADEYLALADAFRVPLSKYLETESVLRAREAAGKKLQWSLYNPIGQWFRVTVGFVPFSKYPQRIASVEAMRRAALLTTQLRSRGITHAQLGTQLDASPLRNPFDGEAFEWSESEQAVVYVGPDSPAVKQHFYFY